MKEKTTRDSLKKIYWSIVYHSYIIG